MSNKILYILFLFISIKSFSQTGKSGVKSVYISKTPKPTSPPNLIVSNISFNDQLGNNNSMLDANEKAELKFTVTNEGKGEAYNLKVDSKELNQIRGIVYTQEKNIGTLLPGKKIYVSIPIEGSFQLETGKVEFEIIVEEANDFDADRFLISFNSQKFKNPQLEVSDYKFTTNVDGKIKLGNPVQVSVLLQNKGQGEANNVNITFTNPENVFPAADITFHINKLKPNETNLIVYEFFTNKKYIGKEIPIIVEITESLKKYGEKKVLTVSLDQTLTKTQEIVVNAKTDKQVKIDDISLTSDVDKNIPVTGNIDEDKFALIIGNEDYSTFQQGVSSEMNVEFAMNDASIFKEYCLKTFGVPRENIIYLTNATAGQMNQAIDKISKLTEAKNGKAKIIVYYAGHGLPNEETKEPYLIPVDVSGTNINSAIKLSDLYLKLTEYPSQGVTVFLDACFSGGGRDAGLLAARSVKIKPKSNLIAGNIIVFTSSSSDESSMAWKEKQHGMFTYFLLKKAQETKGSFTFSELDNYLKENVKLESIRTNSKNQNPKVLYSSDREYSWGEQHL
jgi:hypothetical protein